MRKLFKSVKIVGLNMYLLFTTLKISLHKQTDTVKYSETILKRSTKVQNHKVGHNSSFLIYVLIVS